MGLCRSDLVELFEQFPRVEFSVVFGLESMNGHVVARGVGSAKEFAGPVHGIFLDLNRFGFVC